MKTITSEYKDKIWRLGREIDSILTYKLGETTITLTKEELNSVVPTYSTSLLKSIMKQLDVDSNVYIPVGTVINYKFGLKNSSGNYEYIDFGNYVIKEINMKKDTGSYEMTCYDKMLYSMKDYEKLNITYPITIRSYITAIATKMGLEFAKSGSEFANYDKTIQSELYLDENGKTLGYKFRDVLDELSAVVGGNLYINKNDKLDIKYPEDTMSSNLCPETYNKKWVFTGGAYLDSNNNIVLPNINSTASVRIKWNKKANYFRIRYKIVSGGNSYLTTSYIDENGKTLSGNGYATNDKEDGYVDTTSFGGSNTYGPDILKAEEIQIKFSRTNAYGKNAYSINDIMVGVNVSEYIYYGDTIDENYLNDTNVSIGEKYGPINSLVLSRSANSDNIYRNDETSITNHGLCEFKITDNQILNNNDRGDYIDNIFNQIKGITYYECDYESVGITYYDVLDYYNIKVGDNVYKCLMFNDEIEISQGLKESITAKAQKETKTDYEKADKDDRKINQAYIIVDKVEQKINAYTGKVDELGNKYDGMQATMDSNSLEISNIKTYFDDDGNAKSVKTVQKKFTLNDEGLEIKSSENTFTAKLDETGTFYKDGDEIVGQYTKDGSKQKDMELFGVYKYGKNRIDDDPMFIAQLFHDNNGEQGFGHFYNGGSY